MRLYLSHPVWQYSPDHRIPMRIKAARINAIDVSVCGVGELPDFAGHGVTHVVSLWDGYEAENPEPRFRLGAIFPNAKKNFGFFNDVFSEFSEAGAPSLAAIREILAFTAGLSASDYLLVHCAAGISRSTAVAFAMLCQHAGPGLEANCLAAIRRIRPSARPNRLIVRFADEILGRKGKMKDQVFALRLDSPFQADFSKMKAFTVRLRGSGRKDHPDTVIEAAFIAGTVPAKEIQISPSPWLSKEQIQRCHNVIGNHFECMVRQLALEIGTTPEISSSGEWLPTEAPHVENDYAGR